MPTEEWKRRTDAGFRIRSDIDRIWIQPLRTKRIRIHDFFKTGSGSRNKTVSESRIQTTLSCKFSSILWWFLIRNCCLFHFLTVLSHKFSSKNQLKFFQSPFCTLFLLRDPGTESGFENRMRIQRNLNTGSGCESRQKHRIRQDPEPLSFRKSRHRYPIVLSFYM